MMLAVLADLRLAPFFLLAFANYLIFAGLPALRGTARVMDAARRQRMFKAAKEPVGMAFHSCALCDRTEVTDPRLEFRVDRDGREYCRDHLPE